MVCVGLLTTIRTAALRGCVVVDAGLASGIAGLELVGVPGTGLGLGDRCGCSDWDSGRVCRCLEFGKLGAGLGARRKNEHRSQSSDA